MHFLAREAILYYTSDSHHLANHIYVGLQEVY
jgi:hypothetical protein